MEKQIEFVRLKRKSGFEGIDAKPDHGFKRELFQTLTDAGHLFQDIVCRRNNTTPYIIRLNVIQNFSGVGKSSSCSGGLRADLTCPTTDSTTDFCPPFTPPLFPITRGQVLGVLPFGNVVVTLSINGAELKVFLENGVSAMPAVNGRFPEVSGVCFTYDISAPAGSRVTSAVRQAADGSCTGVPIDLTSTSMYTLAINDFIAAGEDGYPVVTPRATTQGIMDQVLADYITAQGTVSPAIQGRIACITSGATACPVVTP
jgi:hypothetical protein